MFLIISLNIIMVKRKVREWKSLTSFFFVASMGSVIFQIELRAERVWIKSLQYDASDAFLLSKYQSLALVEMMIGCLALILLFASIGFTRHI